jgi:hypothetical protein
LPANGTPAYLPAGGGYPYSCAGIPGSWLTKQGKLKNVLIGQTITLGLNLRIKENLASLVIESATLEYANSSGCLGGYPEQHPIPPIYTKTFPASVLTLLPADPTILDLFNLANDALGGCEVASNYLSPINDAVSMINETFDGCKWGTFQGNGSGTKPIILGNDQLTTEDQSEQIILSVLPNPFINSTTIKFNVAKTSQVTLEIYNLMGSKIATLFESTVTGGETRAFTYTPDASRGTATLICVLRTEYGTKITKMIMMH